MRLLKGAALSRSFLSLTIVRIVLVVLTLVAWFGTQSLIGSRPYTGGIGDGVLDLLTPAHDYFFTHVGARKPLISTSGIIDLLGIFLLGQAIFGKSLRPFVGLIILFGLRQICQAVCVLPMPVEMIWPKEGPGFPSLLVTYGVGNDLFFSGHTAIAIFGATELARLRRWLIPVGVGIALFEMVAVLMLRAHWTMDVYAGAVTALLVACIAGPVAKPIDRILARLTGRNSNDEARMTNQI